RRRRPGSRPPRGDCRVASLDSGGAGAAAAQEENAELTSSRITHSQDFVMSRFVFALLSITIAVSAAQAQFPYPPPAYVNPYFPQGSPGYNVLNGQADVMRAQGDLINATEQAHIQREKVKQERLNTKRKAFDEMMYEKANTPTYFEELSKDKQQF